MRAVAEKTVSAWSARRATRIIPSAEFSAAGWSWGYCSDATPDGWRWIVDTHKGDGKRYIVHSDELLNAFLELEQTLL